MNQSLEVEVKVGIFVAIGVTLIAFTIVLLGGAKSLYTSNAHYKTKFEQVEGIVEGAIVKVAGVRVGQVDKIKFLKDTGAVELEFSVNRKYSEGIHEDSTVGIRTQGVMGDRYIVINTGTPAAPLAKEGFELHSEAPKDLKDYLNSADEVLSKLKSSLTNIDGILNSFNRDSRAEVFFKNISGMSGNMNVAAAKLPASMSDMKESMAHMKSIMTKIDRGEGTVGALINDPSLYDDLKALLGGANRNKVLKYFVRKSVEEARDAKESAEKK